MSDASDHVIDLTLEPEDDVIITQVTKPAQLSLSTFLQHTQPSTSRARSSSAHLVQSSSNEVEEIEPDVIVTGVKPASLFPPITHPFGPPSFNNENPSGPSYAIRDKNPLDKAEKMIQDNKIKALEALMTETTPQEPKRSVLKCAICLGEPDETTELSATTCGHVFCQTCLAQCKDKKCPTCRKSLKSKNSVHRLYLS